MDSREKEVRETSQWIKDLGITRKRSDGKTYHTTVGNEKKDAKIQEEKLKKERMRKEKFKLISKKWFPRIINLIAIIGALYLAYIVLYALFYIVIGIILLIAVGSGVQDAGRQGQRETNYYNNLNERRKRGYW